MAILIDMEMPRGCDDCDLKSNGYCDITNRLVPYDGSRHGDCPLVEVDSDNLIDAERVIHTQVYDDEHEEVIDRSMTIADFLDEYTEEGCPMSVMDVEE